MGGDNNQCEYLSIILLCAQVSERWHSVTVLMAKCEHLVTVYNYYYATGCVKIRNYCDYSYFTHNFFLKY